MKVFFRHSKISRRFYIKNLIAFGAIVSVKVAPFMKQRLNWFECNENKNLFI